MCSCCALIDAVGDNAATFKLLTMHCCRKCWTPESGVDLNRAAKLLGQTMSAVLGGVWHTSVSKWTHVHGTANEVYAAMIEDTLAVAWCHVPAVIQVFSDNTCKAFDVGRR